MVEYGGIYWGAQFLSAGLTIIFFTTFTIFTALWSMIVFRSEPFKWNKRLGVIIGFIGMIFVFFDQVLATNVDIKVITGVFAVVFEAAGGALSVILIKTRLSHINPYSLTFHQIVFKNNHAVRLFCFEIYLGLL